MVQQQRQQAFEQALKEHVNFAIPRYLRKLTDDGDDSVEVAAEAMAAEAINGDDQFIPEDSPGEYIPQDNEGYVIPAPPKTDDSVGEEFFDDQTVGAEEVGDDAAASNDDQVAAATDDDQVAAASNDDQVAAATDDDQVAAATDDDQVAAATDDDQIAAATGDDQAPEEPPLTPPVVASKPEPAVFPSPPVATTPYTNSAGTTTGTPMLPAAPAYNFSGYYPTPFNFTEFSNFTHFTPQQAEEAFDDSVKWGKQNKITTTVVAVVWVAFFLCILRCFCRCRKSANDKAEQKNFDLRNAQAHMLLGELGDMQLLSQEDPDEVW